MRHKGEKEEGEMGGGGGGGGGGGEGGREGGRERRREADERGREKGRRKRDGLGEWTHFLVQFEPRGKALGVHVLEAKEPNLTKTDGLTT